MTTVVMKAIRLAATTTARPPHSQGCLIPSVARASASCVSMSPMVPHSSPHRLGYASGALRAVPATLMQPPTQFFSDTLRVKEAQTKVHLGHRRIDQAA